MSEIAKARTKLFVKKYGKSIARAIENTNLFFPAVVGQKCMESSYGTSPLAVKYNNFGGIRYGGGLQGSTGSTNSGYAIFATPEDCFNAYVRTLTSPTKKYISKGVFTADSPEQQIQRMVEAGYSTTPADKYVSLCSSAISATRDIYKLGKITNYLAAANQINSSES